MVPAIWPLEVGNVLVVVERRKRLSEADIVHFLALINDLPITVVQERPERMTREIMALARKHQLSTYDASYLDLAMRKGLPIATQDKVPKLSPISASDLTDQQATAAFFTAEKQWSAVFTPQEIPAFCR